MNCDGFDKKYILTILLQQQIKDIKMQQKLAEKIYKALKEQIDSG